MSQNTVNPYAQIGAQIAPGLTSIGNAASLNNVDDLVNAVYAYIQPLYYSGASTQVDIEIKSVAYNAVNSCMNWSVMLGDTTYNAMQAPFIELLIGSSMTSNLAPDSFQDRVLDIEDNIGTASLTATDQTPLFLATTVGNNAYQYWAAQIAGGGGSLWNPHFSSNAGQNYMNSLLWNSGAMNGALAAYAASPIGMIEPITAVVSTKMISALIGALTITAGKVLFNWTPRVTKPLQLSINRISNLGNTSGPIPEGVSDTCMMVDRHSQSLMSYCRYCHSYNCPPFKLSDIAPRPDGTCNLKS